MYQSYNVVYRDFSLYNPVSSARAFASLSRKRRYNLSPLSFQTPVSHLPPSLLCQRSISSHTLFVFRAFCWSLSVFAAFDPRVRRLVRRLGYHPDVTEAQRRRYGFPPAAALRYAPLDRCLPDRYVIHVAFPQVDEICMFMTIVYALPRISSSNSLSCAAFPSQRRSITA